ncbi:MAG: 3TM-type holin [Acidiferrobacterales bacterium]
MAIPFIGKIIEKVIGVGGDIIKELVTDKDLAKQLDHAFRTQVSLQASEFKQLELDAEKEMFVAQQKTIQAELHQNDQYTKRTRPNIARKSFYAGLVYALLTSIPEAGLDLHWVLIMPWQFESTVLMLLYSPALTYMGVRGFEKWKNGK